MVWDLVRFTWNLNDEKMNKPDVTTLSSVIKLIDEYPSMDVKELRGLLVKIIGISQLPQSDFNKVADAIQILKAR